MEEGSHDSFFNRKE